SRSNAATYRSSRYSSWRTRAASARSLMRTPATTTSAHCLASPRLKFATSSPAGSRSVSSASRIATSEVTVTPTISASPSFSGAGVHGLPSVVYSRRSTLTVPASGAGGDAGTPATSMFTNSGGRAPASSVPAVARRGSKRTPRARDPVPGRCRQRTAQPRKGDLFLGAQVQPPTVAAARVEFAADLHRARQVRGLRQSAFLDERHHQRLVAQGAAVVPQQARTVAL